MLTKTSKERISLNELLKYPFFRITLNENNKKK